MKEICKNHRSRLVPDSVFTPTNPMVGQYANKFKTLCQSCGQRITYVDIKNKEGKLFTRQEIFAEFKKQNHYYEK